MDFRSHVEPTSRRKRLHRFELGRLTLHVDLGVVMGFPLLTTEQVAITANATDAAGDADPNAVFTFASADETIITVTDLGSGNAEIVAQGVGTTQVVVTATDPSGNSISASADVDVSEPLPPDTDATAVNIAFGAAEPKP